MVHPTKQDTNGKGKHAIPETGGTKEGSAKKNITRKNNHHDRRTKENKMNKQYGSSGGKGKWNVSTIDLWNALLYSDSPAVLVSNYYA